MNTQMEKEAEEIEHMRHYFCDQPLESVVSRDVHPDLFEQLSQEQEEEVNIEPCRAKIERWIESQGAEVAQVNIEDRWDLSDSSYRYELTWGPNPHVRAYAVAYGPLFAYPA